MISKQKIFMLVSNFLLVVAMVIYVFNSVIIPQKINEYSNDISQELKEKQVPVFYITAKLLEKGVYINKNNYQLYMKEESIISEQHIAVIDHEDINNGFYTERQLENEEVIVKSDTVPSKTEKGCNTYEIIVKNSFCGDLCAGEIVDIIYIEGARVNEIAKQKQVKGVYGFSNNRYIQSTKIQSGSDAIIFLELTDEEYEDYLSKENAHIRRTGDVGDS